MVNSINTKGLDRSFQDRIAARLERIYGSERAALCLPQLLHAIEAAASGFGDHAPRKWDQSDIALITYGDMVSQDDGSPLSALHSFLVDEGIHELLSTVHILPFFPYSSDDGFSVIDYEAVDPKLGTWEDVQSLSSHFRLAFDLVLNHISSQSNWFEKFRKGTAPYTGFFHVVAPDTNLSEVVRPRSSPLLTSVETSEGPKHVWTTFSADQVDLNFGEPALLIAMIEVLLFYVSQGAQIIRLDAIAYLWKRIGTNCIHLNETHEVVKLMRDVFTAVAPQVWILTETNVPHEENISYFGDGDEAQMVYQFSLPPLLLDAFVQGDATTLMNWLKNLEAPPEGTTYFNFTASHDGIGMRPLEGIVPEQQVDSLVDAMSRRGGLVSTRLRTDGKHVPYELNITYVDAFSPDHGDEDYHARRFLASQAIMLALQGVPAVYFHSLVGTHNDVEGAEQSQHARRINRRKFHRDDLDQQINSQDTTSGKIYQGYRHLLKTRRAQPAFHPDAKQEALELQDTALLGFMRSCSKSEQVILTVANVSDVAKEINLTEWLDSETAFDLISETIVSDTEHVTLEAGQVCWLSPHHTS